MGASDSNIDTICVSEYSMGSKIELFKNTERAELKKERSYKPSIIPVAIPSSIHLA
jgi:hypothetical protein